MSVFASIWVNSTSSADDRPGASNSWPNSSRGTPKKGAITRVLNHPPRGADVYVQDEVELSLFPTLTRTWMPRGQQRRVRAPGVHPPKREEVAAIDWRSGVIVRIRSLQRNAAAFCRLVEKCMARSARRKRRVILVTDRARFQRRETSTLVAALLERYGQRLQIRYVPSYSPECNPTELLWKDWRHHVTDNHERTAIAELEHDSDNYFRRCARNTAATLRTIGSPLSRRYNRRN